MDVTVLTPSFNYGRFLPECIESVRAQGSSWRHVVMDAGSTDQTLDVLREHAHAGLRWVSEPDGGQSDALNKALALADTEWIGWLNADEFYLPGLGGLLEEWSERHPDAGVLFGDALMVDATGRFAYAYTGHRMSKAVMRYYTPTVVSCAFFVRRSVLGDNPWSTDLRVAMDWDLYLGLLGRGTRFVHVPRPLGCFRLHEEQVTHGGRTVSGREDGLVKQRHGAPRNPALLAALRVPTRVWRAGLKLASGGVAYERNTRSYAGCDVNWVARPESQATAESVMRVSRRLRVRRG